MKVGITGGIGAGKSTVAKMFQLLGVPIYIADDEAKSLMLTNTDLKTQIIEEFGKESYFERGELNRMYLAERVFSKEEALKKLNALVHPKVAVHFLNWHTQKIIEGNKYTLKEAALLFETGSYKELDHVILVSAPEDLRVERVLKRDPQRTEDQIRAIIGKQMPENEKKQLASSIIINDDTQLVIPQVLKLHQTLSGM